MDRIKQFYYARSNLNKFMFGFLFFFGQVIFSIRKENFAINGYMIVVAIHSIKQSNIAIFAVVSILMFAVVATVHEQNITLAK